MKNIGIFLGYNNICKNYQFSILIILPAKKIININVKIIYYHSKNICLNTIYSYLFFYIKLFN